MEKVQSTIDNLEKTVHLLDKYNYRYALAGGLAFSALVEPRATLDIDLILLIDEHNFHNVSAHFMEIFPELIIHPKPMKFSKVKIWRVIDTNGGNDLIIDFILAETDFLKNVIDRVIEIDFYNFKIKTITVEDLILLKFLAGRKQDVADIEKTFLYLKDELDLLYLNKWSKILNVKLEIQ
jgi:predicted nucleotidyltransferase